MGLLSKLFAPFVFSLVIALVVSSTAIAKSNKKPGSEKKPVAAETGSAAKASSAKKIALQVGDTAPKFTGIDDQKKVWDSTKRAGKKIYVIYFYPADMTSGCTKQACAYRDALKELKRDDVEVVGISGDSAENHQHFKNEYKLNFTLLADTEGKIAKAFGVNFGKGGSIMRQIAGEKMELTRGVTTNRWTFVVDKDWKIVHKDTKVNAAKDSETVLKVLEKLK